jgi:UDP-glucose 4-epimerase
MNILIIGSKGFIGSHCLNYFKQKNTVYGCDVIVDYTDENYFLIDSTNIDFREIFERHSFDVCINCSGAASVPESIKNPRRDFELNVHNVLNIIDAIRLYAPNCKFIQFSSAAVYGNPAMLPIKEDSLCAPISPYGWHKLYSEQICKEYVTIYNSKIAILRPFSVYGTGLKKQLFWDVYNKVKKNEPFELFGTGNETRDFIHVSDLVYLIDLIIEQGSFSGTVYNAANGVATSIRDIVDTFIKLTGSSLTYTFNNQVKSGDPIYWQADINTIKELNYFQKTSIIDGLNEYVQWAKENG